MIQNITHMYIFVSANIPDQLAGNYDRNSVFIMRIIGFYLKLHRSINVIVFEYLSPDSPSFNDLLGSERPIRVAIGKLTDIIFVVADADGIECFLFQRSILLFRLGYRPFDKPFLFGQEKE